jgi:hypothetical protein
MKKKYIGIVLASVFVLSFIALSSLNVVSVVATSSSDPVQECLDYVDSVFDSEMDDWFADHPNGLECWDDFHEFLDIAVDRDVDIELCLDPPDWYDACMKDCDRYATHESYYCEEDCENDPGYGQPGFDQCTDDCGGDYEDTMDWCEYDQCEEFN